MLFRSQRLKRFIYILSIPILSELISAGFSLWKTPDRKGMGKGAEWQQPDILQQALNIVLPKMDGFNLRLRMGDVYKRQQKRRGRTHLFS